MITSEEITNETDGVLVTWHGLGGWNFYFIVKFALLWFGYLNFHPLANLIFLAFLLFPLSSPRIRWARTIFALPIGLALFYHDTWLPNIHSLVANTSNVLHFSPAYLLELLNRFINWQMLGVGFVLLVAYLFFSQWVRITVFTILIVCYLNLVAFVNSSTFVARVSPKTVVDQNQTVKGGSKPNTQEREKVVATNDNLNDYLTRFYNDERNRHTVFPTSLAADAVPFDVLIIHICSLAWSDLEYVHLTNHPLWNKFDILFKKFNSASSYSAPAGIRLLRASCGQTSHNNLFKPAGPECYLMDNLSKLGFSSNLALDHNGVFGDFLSLIREGGNILNLPMMSQEGIPLAYVEFDGSPLYNDAELLNRWLAQKKNTKNTRSATYINIITLHDGNRTLTNSASVPYATRASNLFDQLERFLVSLEQSDRKMMVVVIPEHGANLTGDKLQMPGLRDIPSPAITHIPVGIKFIGMKAPAPSKPLEINNNSSYLAVSELIARLVDGKLFNEPVVDLARLVAELPQTAVVSENEGVTVMRFEGIPYVLLSGDTNWIPYPQ